MFSPHSCCTSLLWDNTLRVSLSETHWARCGCHGYQEVELRRKLNSRNNRCVSYFIGTRIWIEGILHSFCGKWISWPFYLAGFEGALGTNWLMFLGGSHARNALWTPVVANTQLVPQSLWQNVRLETGKLDGQLRNEGCLQVQNVSWTRCAESVLAATTTHMAAVPIRILAAANQNGPIGSTQVHSPNLRLNQGLHSMIYIWSSLHKMLWPVLKQSRQNLDRRNNSGKEGTHGSRKGLCGERSCPLFYSNKIMWGR